MCCINRGTLRAVVNTRSSQVVLNPLILLCLSTTCSAMATFVSMATCHTCNKTSRSCGVSRDTVAALSKTHHTPRNSGKPKTAGRTPHSGGGKVLLKSTEKTPYGTPRSASSESAGTPPSKPGSAKKSAFSRLRKILTLSETPPKEKGGLKAFLSSL